MKIDDQTRYRTLLTRSCYLSLIKVWLTEILRIKKSNRMTFFPFHKCCLSTVNCQFWNHCYWKWKKCFPGRIDLGNIKCNLMRSGGARSHGRNNLSLCWSGQLQIRFWACNKEFWAWKISITVGHLLSFQEARPSIPLQDIKPIQPCTYFPVVLSDNRKYIRYLINNKSDCVV